MIVKGKATVVKHTGSHYMLSQLPQWDLLPAVLRGKIRLKGSNATNPVAVGDVVHFEADVPDEAVMPRDAAMSAKDEVTRHEKGDDLGNAEVFKDTARGMISVDGDRYVGLEYVTLESPVAITAVEPRRNYIIRKSTNLSRQSHIIASNLDRAFLVVTLDYPQVKLPFLDRLLVTCEVYNVPATIVLNKCDLYGPEHEDMRLAFHEIYEGAGYPVIEVSAHTGEGVDLLREVVGGKILPDGTPNEKYDPSKPVVSLFSGVSGVGKSSLIKALDPSLEPRVGDISDAHEQGRHTTTFYEMYRVRTSLSHTGSEESDTSEFTGSARGECGFIVDTPGLRGFGLVDLKKEEIALYFPEMLRVSEDCRFAPCTHTHEPGCAVKEAVENGDITYDRYSSYLGMLEEEGKYR